MHAGRNLATANQEADQSAYKKSGCLHGITHGVWVHMYAVFTVRRGKYTMHLIAS